jgi:rpsU-divergently transcribed protein
MGVDEQRRAILDAVLINVAFEGWTGKAVRAGLTDLGLPMEAADVAFPGGVAEMVEFWSTEVDRQMVEQLAELDLAALPVGERVATAVRVRLDLCSRHREAVRRAIAFLALPPNTAQGLRSTYATVNAIWYAAGDDSTDLSFYTKRASLAAVYSATVLYWLDDESDECADTWSFLDRRLDDVIGLIKARRRATDSLKSMLQPFTRFWPLRS